MTAAIAERLPCVLYCQLFDILTDASTVCESGDQTLLWVVDRVNIKGTRVRIVSVNQFLVAVVYFPLPQSARCPAAPERGWSKPRMQRG